MKIMGMDNLGEQIERLKLKASIFFKNGTRAFISNIDQEYFFCHIVSIEEDYVLVNCFAGKRCGVEVKIYWVDVVKMEEYRERGTIENG